MMPKAVPVPALKMDFTPIITIVQHSTNVQMGLLTSTIVQKEPSGTLTTKLAIGLTKQNVLLILVMKVKL